MGNTRYEYRAAFGVMTMERAEMMQELLSQWGREGFRLVGCTGNGQVLLLVLQRESEAVQEVGKALPEGQLDKPRRIGLFVRTGNHAPPFAERLHGKIHYGMPGAPCLDEEWERDFFIEDVRDEWQTAFRRAAREISNEHYGEGPGKFKVWLPGLADDEELLK